MKQYDRIVIGAGISGLLAARRALARGETVLLLERSQRIGGSLKPITLGACAGITPVTVDAGAEAFSVVRPDVFKLLHELGMEAEIVAPRTAGSHIVFNDQLRYRIPHGILGIPASLDDPELARIMSPAASAQARIQDALPVQLRPGMSVAELVTERLGEDFVTKLVDPVLYGVHGTTARFVTAHTVLEEVLRVMPTAGSLCAAVAQVRRAHPRPGSALASLRGGMHRLPQTLFTAASQAGAQLMLSSPVQTAHQIADTWQVSTGHRTFTSAHLTVATGASIETLFDKNGAPQFRDHIPANCSVLRTAGPPSAATATAVVFALVTSKKLDTHPLDNGALAAASQTTARATTHVNAKWAWVDAQLPPEHHIVRLSYGNYGAPATSALMRTAKDDIERLYEVSDVCVQETQIVHWPHALSRPGEAKPGAHTHVNAEHCGPIVSGNGVLAIVSDHFMSETLKPR